MFFVELNDGSVLTVDKVLDEYTFVENARKKHDLNDALLIMSGVDVPVHEDVERQATTGSWYTFSSEKRDFPETFSGKLIGEDLRADFTRVSLQEVSVFGECVYTCDITLSKIP